MAKTDRSEIVTLRNDPQIPAFQGGVLEPADDILKKMGRGKGHALYDEIYRDPHAFAVLQKRKLEVQSREWMVEEASGSRLDRKAADLVREQFKPWIDGLTVGLMGAILKGFAVAEIIWQTDGTGWGFEKISVKKQRRFRFDIDSQLRVLTREAMIEGIPAPGRKFIVHRYSIDDDDDDPYGVGLGAVLYWPAWFKRQALAHWLRSNEKHATPTAVAQYQGAYDKARQDEIGAALARMANDTTLVIPDNVMITLLDSKNGGGSADHDAINRYLDELMSEATLGETLTTNSGQNGARALGEVHNDVRIAIAKADSDLISQTLNRGAVKWLVELNYPGATPPSIWRDFSESEDLDARSKRDKEIYDMGYRPRTVEYINETYGGDWIEAQSAQPVDPAQKNNAGAAVNALFAEAQATPASEAAQTADDLTNQLEVLADPLLEEVSKRIKQAVEQSSSFEELETKLLVLSSDIGIDDLGSLFAQAIAVAALRGTEAAQNDG
jgi:phage gp29-like protein